MTCIVRSSVSKVSFSISHFCPEIVSFLKLSFTYSSFEDSVPSAEPPKLLPATTKSNGAKPTDDVTAGHDVTKNPARTNPRKKREIRVFVSSTFLDFAAEREILIKKVFNELKKMCLDRGVFFSYVDLRWGITNDQSNDGQTISICLREVGHIFIWHLQVSGITHERMKRSRKQYQTAECHI